MENPESVMLTLKMFLFLAMEMAVFVIVGAVLVIGLFKLVQSKIRESRILDQLSKDSQPTSSASHRA